MHVVWLGDMSAGESCGPFWGALLTTPHIGIQAACGANFAPFGTLETWHFCVGNISRCEIS